MAASAINGASSIGDWCRRNAPTGADFRYFSPNIVTRNARFFRSVSFSHSNCPGAPWTAEKSLRLVSFPRSLAGSMGKSWTPARCRQLRRCRDCVAPARQRDGDLFATVGPPDVAGCILSGHTDVVPTTEPDWSSDPVPEPIHRRVEPGLPMLLGIPPSALGEDVA